MYTLKKLFLTGLTILFTLTLSACAPEVGSKEWCANMEEKNKADWTGTDDVKHE